MKLNTSTKLNTSALLVAVGLMGSACGSSPGDDFEFVLVLPAPQGTDISDLASEGALRAIDELGVQGEIIETHAYVEQENAMQLDVSSDHDLMIGLANEGDFLVRLAGDTAGLIGGVDLRERPSANELPDNLTAYTINVHESSYLAGVVAGSLTQTDSVGAVAGAEIPTIDQFYLAYKQGVLSVCPDCDVTVTYLDFQFDDAEAGRDAAVAQYEAGVDIVFQIAGGSGEGVLAAAAESGNFAIGVDVNQDDTHPGSVIVSLLKRIDVATFKLIERSLDGTGHGLVELGLADDATGLSWDVGSTTFADNGPADVTATMPDAEAAVATARQAILDGSLEVCDALLVTAACDGLK